MTNKIFPDGAALVIGGSGGVGQAVCREFVRAGTAVAITYNKKREVAEKLAGELRWHGRQGERPPAHDRGCQARGGRSPRRPPSTSACTR